MTDSFMIVPKQQQQQQRIRSNVCIPLTQIQASFLRETRSLLYGVI